MAKFVLNRKLFLLCFQQRHHQNIDFAGFICIEYKWRDWWAVMGEVMRRGPASANRRGNGRKTSD